MRPYSMTTAIALALTLGAATASTAQSTRDAERTPRSGEAARSGRDGASADTRDGRGGPQALLLRGITLTDDQERRIAQLRERERAQLEAEQPRADAARNDAGTPLPRSGRGDSAGPAERRARMEQRRAQHVAAVRAILTAEQRERFDANVAALAAREAESARGERPAAPSRHGGTGRGG